MSEQASPSANENLSFFLTLLLIILLALVPTCLCGLFYLSRVPDVTWQRGALSYNRLWLADVRGPAGLGFESQWVSKEYSPTEVCVENSVRFFLWSAPPGSANQDVAYNQRWVLQDGDWQPSGKNCH